MDRARKQKADVTIRENTESGRPTIVESYRDFRPPANFRRIVEDLLQQVPTKYLNGLQTIVLTNGPALPIDKRKQKTWSRNHKIRLVEARGFYTAATKTSRAEVWLNVENIVRGLPGWMMNSPLIRYMVPSEVLYHEIGHHIHAVHKPVHEGPENVAEDWSRKLWRGFFRKRYWYLIPVAYPISVLIKLGKQIKKRLRRVKANSTSEKNPGKRS